MCMFELLRKLSQHVAINWDHLPILKLVEQLWVE
jgi:hypothetical protein